ncbi:MAG TPA: YihY/virulence factor BrkB family protein [Gemmatimonadales bacterium]|nr:YihY/virulence factor BrkB family protein [Gemmatimonadales bacterium]
MHDTAMEQAGTRRSGETASGTHRRGPLGLVRSTFRDFMEDDCMTMAAALSYYTVFSLPPLLIFILMLLGAVLSPEDVRGTLESQINNVMGPAGGQQVRTILQHAQAPSGGVASVIGGIAALIFGATGAFGQLQKSLNRAWEVEPDPEQGGFRNFVGKRVLSLGMVLAIAFLLLVSFVVSAALSAFGQALGHMIGGGVSDALLTGLNAAISFGVITLLFAGMFKVLPDAEMQWKDVWVGAAITALLFVIGKFLLGLYLGHSSQGEAFGAARSLILVFLWIYYASNILLLGAEFTQSWAERHGGIRPEKGAVRIVETKRRVRASGPQPEPHEA